MCIRDRSEHSDLLGDVRREGRLTPLPPISPSDWMGEKDDYLGIEALFIYDSDQGEFYFDGLNTDAI